MQKSWPGLPPLLAEFAEVIGIGATLELARAKGGQQVRIASRLDDDNWLVQTIGREKAEKLSFHLLAGRGRIDVYIPLGPTGSYAAERRQRAEIIRSALKETNSVGAAAQRAGVTRRSVHRHKAGKPERNPDQGSLL